ncbi:MAG: hypothetical protein H6737_21445 [Alphaproteobacteria bacterium]|nr:hypothetical protein [Alphaproteobacteria bacterium]
MRLRSEIRSHARTRGHGTCQRGTAPSVPEVSMILLLCSDARALDVPLQSNDPVADCVPWIEARTGMVITTETASDAHRKVPALDSNGEFVRIYGTDEIALRRDTHPFSLHLPPLDATGSEALSSLLEQASSWQHWDGCTRYGAQPTPYGLHVRPTYIVATDGTCRPCVSPLDRVESVEDSPPGGEDLSALLGRYDVAWSGRRQIEVTAGPLQLGDLLERARGNGTWVLRSDPGQLRLLLLPRGNVNPSGVDLEDLPFHPLARRAAVLDGLPADLRATYEGRLERMNAEADAVIEELRRLQDAGMDEAAIRRHFEQREVDAKSSELR